MKKRLKGEYLRGGEVDRPDGEKKRMAFLKGGKGEGELAFTRRSKK